jgi:hypothetical protein
MTLHNYNGGKIEDDQFLLKIGTNYAGNKVGFMTRLNKDGSIPKAFIEWRAGYGSHAASPLDTFVIDEYFRPGWEFVSTRMGASQTWAVMKHPEGFLVEIYFNDLQTILRNDCCLNGVLGGHYKWSKNKLIKFKEDAANTQT